MYSDVKFFFLNNYDCTEVHKMISNKKKNRYLVELGSIGSNDSEKSSVTIDHDTTECTTCTKNSADGTCSVTSQDTDANVNLDVDFKDEIGSSKSTFKRVTFFFFMCHLLFFVVLSQRSKYSIKIVIRHIDRIKINF